LAAMRGAVHGLMADLLDSHVRETLAEKPAPSQAAIDETLALLRSYLK
ncbi:MAG: metal-sensing transcriptional repressor, partial [Acidovorax sp.]|nr:metal-sensing transcriptional repressor [Acidovorax sp.]